MSETTIGFDALPESKDTVFVKTAGIHLGFKLIAKEFVPSKEKDGKTSNEQVKLSFQNDKNENVVLYLFAPPTKAEDVKYCGDIYEKGVKIRKRTPEEQIVAEFNERFYFFEQLGKAWNSSKEKMDSFKTSLAGDPSGLFKKMFEKFFTVFTSEFFAEKKINIKMLFNNNDKQKTSFLGLAKPGASNLVFAPYTTDDNPILQINLSEEKNMVRKYTPKDKAPTTAGAEVGGTGEWKPAIAATDNDNPDAPGLF
jgi:hypothetical protein